MSKAILWIATRYKKKKKKQEKIKPCGSTGQKETLTPHFSWVHMYQIVDVLNEIYGPPIKQLWVSFPKSDVSWAPVLSGAHLDCCPPKRKYKKKKKEWLKKS